MTTPAQAAPFPCDIFRVSEQCGVKLLKPELHRKTAGQPRICFAKKTLKRLGRAHGEDHLRLVLRLIADGSNANACELQGDTIDAVSRVVLSGLVEIRADLLDNIKLARVRAWGQLVAPGCSTAATMATALLWQLASPEKIIPEPSAEETAAEEKRREIARKGRENAKRRRIKAAGDQVVA